MSDRSREMLREELSRNLDDAARRFGCPRDWETHGSRLSDDAWQLRLCELRSAGKLNRNLEHAHNSSRAS
jgi:hypothetical protein